MRRVIEMEEEFLIQRLEAILGELECHFHYLISDAQMDKARRSYEASALASKLQIVKNGLTIAIHAMRNQRILALFDAAEMPMAMQQQAAGTLL